MQLTNPSVGLYRSQQIVVVRGSFLQLCRRSRRPPYRRPKAAGLRQDRRASPVLSGYGIDDWDCTDDLLITNQGRRW